ncbi:MAG TPA: signal peptidase I [Galbitalea sp.]|jgi:signal peptidase I|nr:signal peptidase I [Galbitalea sp.]
MTLAADDEGAGAQEGDPQRPHKAVLFARDIIIILLAALVISFLLKTFVIRSFYIPSGSMQNTLQIDDRIVVSLLTPNLVPVQRGDVVVFSDPHDWLKGQEPVLPPSTPLMDALAFLGLVAPNDNSHLIKRVIGLPGDTVACCTAQGHLTVNGVAITEPYILLQPGNTAASPNKFSVTVPTGNVWVLGDNRDDSEDSEWHYTQKDHSPFVPIKDVTGRAMVINWPISHWSFLDNFSSVFARVPNAPKS